MKELTLLEKKLIVLLKYKIKSAFFFRIENRIRGYYRKN